MDSPNPGGSGNRRRPAQRSLGGAPMSLFPKFKTDMSPLATPATSATPQPKSRESRESRNTPVGEIVSWPCSHCGNPADIEAVELSLDGQRMLTFWRCKSCQTWAVTADSIRQPPVWVSEREQ